MTSPNHSNSLTRVRAVQRLLDQSGLDALLCIIGADSGYNAGCWRLYGYLMCDLSGDELDLAELGPAPEEEDTFLLVTPTQVSVCCHPSCYELIATRLGRWHPGVSLLCDLSHPDREDTDHFEMFKIRSFIEMTENVEKIGVPYGGGPSLTSRRGGAGFSPMAVEQWPLVQAYALEEVGGLGFFTMRHRVSDVTGAMERLYSEADPLSVRYLLGRGERLFCKQWGDLVESVSRLEPDGMQELSEQEMLRGMKSYLQHARRSGDVARRAKGYAYVLVSQNSQKLKYKPCPVASNLATVGTSEGVASHCVVELSDPLLPLAAARTLFFSQSHCPYDSEKSGTRPANPDHEYLLHLYQGLVTEVRHGMQSVLSVASLGELRELVSERIRALVSKLSECGDIGVDVGVSSYDLFKVELLDPVVNDKSVFYLKATLTDIMSPSNPSKKLGAIVYGESFIVSRLQIGTKEGVSIELLHSVLTSSVPVLVIWPDRESQILGSQSLKESLRNADQTQLGNPISLGTKDILLSTSFLSDLTFPVKLHAFSRGLILHNSIWKFLWLPWELIAKIQLPEGSDTSCDDEIKISLEPLYLPHIPVFLRSCICSLIYPHTTEHTKLYREFAAFLKSALSAEKLLTSQESAPLPDTGSSLVEDFSQFMEITWLYEGSISSRALSNLTSASVPPSEDRIVVNIVAGLPGSNADSLASLIVDRTRDCFEWDVRNQPLECDHIFDQLDFESSIQSLVENCLKNRATHPAKTYRILLLSPCFSSPSQLVQSLLCHPSSVVSENIRIGAVTLCVGVTSSFSPDDRLHPLVMRSLRPGVVSSVIITGPSPVPQGDLIPQSYSCQLQSLCRSLAIGAGIVRHSHVADLSAEDIACILSDQLFHKLRAVRSWYNPSLYRDSLQPVFAIEHKAIKCSYYFSSDLLISALQSLPKNIRYVRGVVNLSSAAPRYHHLEMAKSCILHPINLPTYPIDTSTLVFYGHELESVDLLSVVQSCLPADKHRFSIRSEHNLSKEELAEIDARCREAPLPEGVFFNGHQYVGFDGDKWKVHPCREEIVSRFLAELNAKVASHNEEIDKFYEGIFSH